MLLVIILSLQLLGKKKGQNVKKLFLMLSVLISVLCLLLAAAPFTPAVAGSFLMLILAGVLGYKGYSKISLLLLCINTFSVVVSPNINESSFAALTVISIIFIFSFTGVALGLPKGVQRYDSCVD